jgi:hypothetical protein
VRPVHRVGRRRRRDQRCRHGDLSVSADGKTLVGTPTIKGGQAATPIDVTGAQVLDLLVGDAGDGNGNDHGDWAVPTLTCTA